MSSTVKIRRRLDDDEDLPDLVNVPDICVDENTYEHYTTRIPGHFSWNEAIICEQYEHGKQALRWTHLTPHQQENVLQAARRLLITPFLFQTVTCPEKWLRWAKLKELMNFNHNTKQLPAGKLTREHYLSVRMMERGLRKLFSMASKKTDVQGIMRIMYSIRETDLSAVDKAILETKSNDNVKSLVDAIQTSNGAHDERDTRFMLSKDRIYFIALLCMRQFAEVVHITTIEARDIASEVQNKFSDHHYYLYTDLEGHRESGNTLYKQKKFGDAVKEYTVAINKAPFHYLLYSNRCQAFIRLQDYETALADAYRSIILKPDWGKGYYKIVTCLSEMGYVVEAIEYANEGLRLCKGNDVIEDLQNILRTVESKSKAMLAPKIPSEVTANIGKKKKRKKKKKTAEVNRDKEQELDSDHEEEDSGSPSEIVRARDSHAMTIVQNQAEIAADFHKWIEKGSVEFLKRHFADACKTYKLAVDLMATHKQIKGHNDNDFATLLYAQGQASQQLGFSADIDHSRRCFVQIINEFKKFSHLSMAYYAEARSIYLLNEFEEAKKKARNAMKMVKKHLVRGLLAWPGTSENIPESDERVLRSEIRLLIQQCCVPPDPTAVCLYPNCANEFSRRQIYHTDLNFDGYYEIECDWHCVMDFHLSCWPKYKHDTFTVSGDKEVLGAECFTPDCGGVVACIKKFDENLETRKCLELPKENKRKWEKLKKSKDHGRMHKSETNMRKYMSAREEKRRNKSKWKSPLKADSPDAKVRRKASAGVADNRDVSQATIYVKSDNSQRSDGRTGVRRTVTPASLYDYCSSLPGYNSELPAQVVDEMIESAKTEGFEFDIPGDVLQETEQFILSFGDGVLFTDDEKLRLPFIFGYFVTFFSKNGPCDVFDDLFSGEAALLPENYSRIVEKCGGLEPFLCASPLFIKVSQFIGTHSQHACMKELTDDIQRKSSTHSPISIDILDPDYAAEVSAFARDFYDTGVTMGESDIANLTGAIGRNEEARHIDQSNGKMSQNSETSSMYSIEAPEGKIDLSSQTSGDTDRSGQQRPATPAPVTAKAPTLKIPRVKKLSKTTQTDSRHDPEKAKEAIERLQERLQELEDESTKLKKTSQTTEETLLKRIEELEEKERASEREKESLKQSFESDMLKFQQMRKQLQVAETKLEQSKARERTSESNLAYMTQGMQRDREAHLREIVDLRKYVEFKDKELDASIKRATSSEIALIRTKEAYHVAALTHAGTHSEQAAGEFAEALAKIADGLPENILGQFEIAHGVWKKNVVTCDESIATLKAAYATVVEQLNSGRPLSELAPVPDLQPPPPGPDPRRMMMEFHRTGQIALSNGIQAHDGSGDSKRPNGLESAFPNAAAALPKPKSQALPSKSMPRTSEPAPVSVQPPIGAELTKAPKKKSFLLLVEKLSKNIPQLSKSEVETCAQIVRNDNNGLTGLTYDEIERRVRQISGLDNSMNPVPLMSMPSSGQQSWKLDEATTFRTLARTGDDEEALCPICCDPLKDGHISMLECSHRFHSDCISTWMKKQRTCPNCRKFMSDTTEFPSLNRSPPGLSRNPFRN